jgi:hypothetical protein
MNKKKADYQALRGLLLIIVIIMAVSLPILKGLPIPGDFRRNASIRVIFA